MDMWVFFAFCSAIFAGLTAILSKIGIRNTDSNVATALRTVVVAVFSWLMVFIVGSQDTIHEISGRTLLFLVLSGLATGASWLCYFRALQIGDVNKVTPIDKSSTILTMLLAFVFLGEEITVLKAAAIVLIGTGTYLMIQKKGTVSASSHNTGTPAEDTPKGPNARSALWLIYAAGSAMFASLTSILGKIGIEGVESNLGTAIRTIVVLIMAWVIVFVTRKQDTIKDIDAKSIVFLILSGFATGGSWLCYYRALQDGPASVVVPVDKMSIVVTIAFSYFFLKEKLSAKALAGLLLIIAGTLSLLF
jgi:transporter family protein